MDAFAFGQRQAARDELPGGVAQAASGREASLASRAAVASGFRLPASGNCG
ncbi:MAG: hypothetical protein MZV70_33215 [Desulfobacterales bacterium]|nr:hypothetical protein [Desulfobacterales bacterium]